MSQNKPPTEPNEIDSVSNPGIQNPFEQRSEAFTEAYNLLNKHGPSYLNGKSVIRALSNTNETLLETLYEQSTLPWFRKQPPREWKNKQDRKLTENHTIKLFFQTCLDVIIERDFSKEEIESELKEEKEKRREFKGDNLPNDGSVGMAEHAMETRILTFEWLLGEFHGEKTEKTI